MVLRCSASSVAGDQSEGERMIERIGHRPCDGPWVGCKCAKERGLMSGAGNACSWACELAGHDFAGAAMPWLGAGPSVKRKEPLIGADLRLTKPPGLLQRLCHM